MKRFTVFAVAGVVVACSHSTILVGDDTEEPASDTHSTEPTPQSDDGDPTPLFDAASYDAAADDDADAGPIKVPYPDASADAAADAGPIACTAAGGTCVGLAPGSCPGNNFGDATKYTCGGGLGVACCLP